MDVIKVDKKEYELVIKYGLNGNNYIIYKDDMNLYIAKKDVYNRLDTNLLSEEVKLGIDVLEALGYEL